MGQGFEILDHTADIGIVAYGDDIKDLFINTAIGLFNLMADLGEVREDVHREIELSAQDEEVLLIEWLNELIYIFEVEHLIFKSFQIDELAGNHIKARCFGEEIRADRHALKREVKAATYHMLRISKTKGEYEVKVIFDV